MAIRRAMWSQCVSPGLSDPYEPVGLPVEDIKEGEPVEPYQKIGPSKASMWMYVKDVALWRQATHSAEQDPIQNKTMHTILYT